jgi:hypothetical protein
VGNKRGKAVIALARKDKDGNLTNQRLGKASQSWSKAKRTRVVVPTSRATVSIRLIVVLLHCN